MSRFPLLASCCLGLLACQTDTQPQSGSQTGGRHGPAQQPEFCTRPAADAIHDAFCGPVAPEIRSLEDLQRLLELEFGEPGPDTLDDQNMVSDYSTFRDRSVVVLNTSTALSGKLVSTINPRAIVLGEHSGFAFNRGIQQVELLSRDRDAYHSNFYLLRFQQACNATAEGCSPADLYTPRIESDWSSMRIDDDEALKNTPSDCRQCHQRAREKPILLMRELDGPWTHFFQPHAPYEDAVEGEIPEANGVDIVRAYYDAKGDERYGGIPWEAIRATFGLTLQLAVDRPQPLVFDGSAIMNERWPWTQENGFSEQPLRSASWDEQYAAFKRGEHLAMPYFDPFPSDPDKLAELTAVYQKYRAGEIPAEDLPDFGDVFPDDPQTRAEIGLQTEPAATPAQTLVQACGSCHNDVLDQSISRARFSIDLSRLDRAELDLAIARLALPTDAPGHMPPADARELDSGAREPLIRYLEGNVRSAEDDAFLQNAARLGMATEVTPSLSGFIDATE